MCFICDMDELHSDVGSGIADALKHALHGALDRQFLRIERKQLELMTLIHLLVVSIELGEPDGIAKAVKTAKAIFGDASDDAIIKLLEAATLRNIEAAQKDETKQDNGRKNQVMNIDLSHLSKEDIQSTLESIFGASFSTNDGTPRVIRKNRH